MFTSSRLHAAQFCAPLPNNLFFVKCCRQSESASLFLSSTSTHIHHNHSFTHMSRFCRYAALTGLEPRFVTYLRKLMLRREEWAHCHRDVAHHTNNHVESAFRILKDVILGRTRAYNISHLIEFVAYRMDMYYARRFIDVANGRHEPTNRPPQPESVQKVR